MKKVRLFCMGTTMMLGVTLMPDINVMGVNIYKGGEVAYAAASSKTITINSKSSNNLKQALSSAKSGDTIVVDGTIKSADINIPDGVTLIGKNDGKIDFSSTSKGKRGITISGDKVTIKDLEIYNAKDNGIYITGNSNKLLNLNVHDNGDTGVQLSNGATNNYIYNVKSHHNVDVATKGENADGFAIKLHSGEGNVLEECVSEYNSDDGYDCYATHGAIKFINCQANYNGQCKGIKGDGNGFKLGGVDNKTPGKAAHLDPNDHYLEGCIAKENSASGFDRNNQMGVVTMKNCIADGNKKANYNWPAEGSPSALGKKVKFGAAKIIDCTSKNGKNNISGAKLYGNCKGS